MKCPACGGRRRPMHLLCGRCWHQVPKDLQDDVWRTWRAWDRNPSDAELMRTYKEAADRAIGAVP